MLYMFLAEGFEEIEALATLDVIRRADIKIQTVGVTGDVVIGSHGISVMADVGLDDIEYEGLEGIVLPGGLPGTTNLESCDKVIEYTEYAFDNSLMVSAICAAPSILGHLGILKGKKATCYPGYEPELTGATATDEFVVRDDNVITGKGAGAAIDFGLKIVEYFKGENDSYQLRKAMQCVR